MKNVVRSLLGIEIALGKTEFKPIILFFGALLFIGMFCFLCSSWLYFKTKLFILDQYKSLLEEHKLYKRKKENKYKY
jgi:hypothetical protein